MYRPSSSVTRTENGGEFKKCGRKLIKNYALRSWIIVSSLSQYSAAGAEYKSQIEYSASGAKDKSAFGMTFKLHVTFRPSHLHLKFD